MPDGAVTFIETSVFKKNIEQLLHEMEIQELQNALISNPERGTIISGTGGVRKLRFAQRQNKQGKRSGIRVIYYYRITHGTILFLHVYSKNRQDSLSDDEKQAIREIVRDFKENYGKSSV